MERCFKEEFMKWKAEQREREEKWRKEREELKEEIADLKQRMDRIESERKEEKKEKQTDDGKNERGRKIETEIIQKSLEKWKEEEERQKRRINIIIKGVDKNEKNIKEVVNELWRTMELEVKAEEIREIGKGDGKGRRMILVRMKDKGSKVEVMRNKNKLRGRTERIQDDWTWKERAMQWRLEKIAWEERKKGKTAWVRYGKIWMEERWWRWSEEEERLIEGDEEERRKKKEKNEETREMEKEEYEETRTEK